MSERSRRRGATFTTIVLVFSSLLLVSGGLLTEALQTSFDYTAQQARRARVREAGFVGVRWALRALGRGQLAGRGKLELSGGVTVAVEFGPNEGAGEGQTRVRAHAVGLGLASDVDATAVQRPTGYLLDGYELREGDDRS